MSNRLSNGETVITDEDGNKAKVNADGQLHVVMEGKVDVNNSTTATLLANIAYIGTATNVLEFSAITILVGSDVAGTLLVQYGPDGTDWHDGESYMIEAGAEKFFTPPVQSAYYRLVYTNGGTNQATFFLHSVLKKNPVKWSSHNINDPITDQDDAELVKAVVTGQDETGVFQNARVNSSGVLLTSNFLAEVALGNVIGYSAVNKYGVNPEITTGTDPEDVWSGGGIYAFYPATAQAMEVLSDDDEDGGAGTDTGGLTIQVYGLDANWEEQNETVTLNGTTIVNLANTYIRMNRAIVLTAGSVETNVGNIIVRIAGAGTIGAYILAGAGQTKQVIYTVPAGKTGLFVKGYVGISKGGGSAAVSADFKWKARPNTVANGAWVEKGDIECISSGSSWWQYEYGIPNGPIPEKTDIRIECSEVSATVGVVAGFDMLLVDN